MYVKSIVSWFSDAHDGGPPPPPRRPVGGGAYGGGGMEYNGQDGYSDPYNSREPGFPTHVPMSVNVSESCSAKLSTFNYFKIIIWFGEK